MATFSQAANAMRDRFKTEFHSREPDVPIGFDNVEGLVTDANDLIKDSTDGSGNPAPWVRFSVRPGDASIVSSVPRVYRHPGSIIVQIFIPTGRGDNRAQEIAEAVAGSMRGVSVSGVRIRATSPPQFIGADDETWWQANVTASFEFDEQE